jgi:hypothetical protein
VFRLQNPGFAPARRPCRTARRGPAVSIAATATDRRFPKEAALSSQPTYDSDTDTYRHIYKGHPSASAVTNSEGLTVFFDPDTNEILGFQITGFSAYYEAHKTPDGEFEVTLPARVPVNLEEEMDFDAESLRSGVRLAEFY